MADFLNDTMTDTAGTTLASHTPTPTGGSYGKLGVGSMQITAGNRCRPSSINDVCLYLNSATPGSNDYTVSADFCPIAAVNGALYPSIVGRCDGTGDNTYKVQYNWDGSPGLYLFKVVAGSLTQLGLPSNFSPSVGTPFSVFLRMTGTTIVAGGNGVDLITETDSDVTAGKAGIGHYATNALDITDATGMQIDNLVATGAGGSTATSFTLTGPTAGPAAAASSVFTVTPDGTTTGTFTPNAQSGCTFSPTTLTLSGTTPQTFTVTRSTAGSSTINGTTSDTLTPPTSIGYTAKAVTSRHLIANFGAANAGVATTGYRLDNVDGTVFKDRTTTSVVDHGLGVYGVTVNVPADGLGAVVWNTATTPDYTAADTLYPPGSPNPSRQLSSGAN